jgi:DNA-binding NarL/FixJ family response regulator
VSRRRTVILAEDHTLVRAGIRALLESLGTVEILAETGDGKEALALVEGRRPDLLLLDLTLPGLNGLEVAERLRRSGSTTRILVLSMHAGPEYVASALEAGASGYLIKDSAVPELANAIDTVLVGREYLSRAIDADIVRSFREKSRSHPRSEISVLTPRQREILQLIAEGHGTRDIAERLIISIKTVETHRAQIMERLGVGDVPGLVRFAIRVGLIEADS